VSDLPRWHVLQPDKVPVADKLDGCGGIGDVWLVLVPLLDPEVVVLVLVRVHRNLSSIGFCKHMFIYLGLSKYC
jgi:hypothetical protein